MIQKEYALLCEFATMSVNGLQSYLHVFDRSTFSPDQKKLLRGFFATRLNGLPPGELETQVYITDSNNTVLDKGTLFKGKIKGPSANIVIRIPVFDIPAAGEYIFWARVDAGEPTRLCTYTVDEKAPPTKIA